MGESADKNWNPFSASFWVGAMDLRPLGLFRITFGFIVTVATLDIGGILYPIISDAGVMPRSALLGGIARGNRFCLFDVAGPYWVTVVLWLLAVAACAAFTVGWHSRFASVATFFLVTGIHERNLLAFDGADNVIRVMLFWAMFMPVGARYSVDAVRRAAKGRETLTHAPAFAMRLGQIQICWVYLNSFIHKWGGGSQWHDGTALHYALGLDHLFTRDFGQWLFNRPWFYVPGTYFTDLVEAVFLILVFFPYLQPKLKALAIVMGTALHAGIWATMNVGNFSYLMPLTFPLLFEPEWAERAVGLTRRLVGKGVTRVYYDGLCPLCRETAALLRGLDPFGALALVDFREKGALAGLPNVSKGDLEQRLHTVSEDGRVLAGFEAVKQVARRLPATWLLGVLGDAPGANALGGTLYGRIAGRRRKEHRAAEAGAAAPAPEPEISWRDLVPAPLLQLGSWAVRGCLALLLAGCVWFALPTDAQILVPRLHLGSLQLFPGYSRKVPELPEPWHGVIQELELWQVWDMFSPNPMDTDIWLKGVGQLSDGTSVDVLHGLGGGPLPPPIPHFIFSRWTKWINNVAYTQQPTLLEFGRYLCREWNNDRPSWRPALKTFKIYREQRRTPAPNTAPVPWGEDMIWDHHCF
ncbi:MAG: DCC1-like thiol-disulfide oxidoreductase family protein [Myxococcales bacterium]